MSIPGSQWTQVPGNAVDIAVATDGTAFHTSPNGHIYAWNGQAWDATGMETSRTDMISGGPNGDVYFIGLYGGIHAWSRAAGHRDLGLPIMPDQCADLAVASDGTIYSLAQWWNVGQRARFTQVDVWRGAQKQRACLGGERIAGGLGGAVWIANSNNIVAWNGTLSSLPGIALDIGVSPEGIVWHIGQNELLYVLEGGTWTGLRDASARRIAVGPGGLPWHINSSGAIYRRQ